MRIRPTPSQVADIDALDIGRIGDVDLHADRRAELRRGGAAKEIAGPVAARGEGRGGASERARSASRRAEHHAAMLGVEQCCAGKAVGGGAEADHHRHAARARQHGDMARRTAGLERNAAAMAPVGFEEARRRDVGAIEDCAGGRCRPCVVHQRAQNLVADIANVGRPGAKIVLVGCLVAGDLGVQRSGPGRIGGKPLRDAGEGRAGQRIVLKHGELEFEDFAGLAGRARDQAGQPLGGRRERASVSAAFSASAEPFAA